MVTQHMMENMESKIKFFGRKQVHNVEFAVLTLAIKLRKVKVASLPPMFSAKGTSHTVLVFQAIRNSVYAGASSPRRFWYTS